MTGPVVRIGLPYSSNGALARAAFGVNAPTLISVGSMFRDGRFTRIGLAAWMTGAALDSAGFTAMLQGGYRWSVYDYVDFVVTNGGDDRSVLPFPWKWWSAMDYCCEPEIAADRAEVERRVGLTVDTYLETLEHLDWWRGEGVNTVPDPMPVLQGRTPADYVDCARRMAAAGRHGQLPELVGVGSVCRRQLHGREGLLAVLATLDRELPPEVRLHLFGVKGALLRHLAPYAARVASVDSMAWDYRARRAAREQGRPNDMVHRCKVMVDWYQRQVAASATPIAQLDLFGRAT